MLTLLGTKEDDNKTSTEYYYPQQHHQHCYYPVSLNDDLNNLHHYHPSNYDANHYYTLSSAYSHQQINEDDSKNQMLQTYHHPHYSSEGHVNEMLYSQKPSDHQQMATVYDENLSLVSPLPSNPIFHQHSNYVQSSIEQSISNSPDYQTPYSPPNGSCHSGSIVVELINRPLWLRFAPHLLENIITKTGRRMFPMLEFKVYGLKPEAAYDMYIDMTLVDDIHWKFNSGKWIPSGQADQCQKTNYHYLHPDSPNSGAHWMKNDKISFSKLKLTNNKKLSTSQSQNQTTLILNSMHKYMPRLNIIEVSSRSTNSTSSLDTNNSSPSYVFSFPETQFIAVTAYQNTDVTQLKIDNNPFAKGFRDSSDNRNIYNPYSYGSPSPPYVNESNTDFEYYENAYEHQQPQKKKRRY